MNTHSVEYFKEYLSMVQMASGYKYKLSEDDLDKLKCMIDFNTFKHIMKYEIPKVNLEKLIKLMRRCNVI